MPTDHEHRIARQQEILALLDTHRVTNQGELVEMLRERGVTATQSSVSRDLRDLGTTVLLTTHYLEEAEAYADRFAVLHRGRIAATGVRGDDPAAVVRAVARAEAA